jgi:hypothetical protein
LGNTVVKNQSDVRVVQALPDANYGTSPTLQVGATGGVPDRISLLWCAPPCPQFVTLRYAKLHIRLKGTGWVGAAAQVTVRRLAAGWKESQATWNTRPAPGAENVVVASVSGADGTELVIDVTALYAPFIAGSTWYGLSIETTKNAVLSISSAEDPTTRLRPTLEISWDVPPDAPTGLRPSTGRAVSIARPTVSWAFSDPAGDTPQTAAQVQVSTDPTFAAVTLWDSGWVATTLHGMALGADMVVGTTYYWRVRVQSSAGIYSAWSDAAQFVRTAKSAVVIDNPPNGGATDGTTPIVAWHFNPAGPVLQQASLALERQDADGWHTVWIQDPYQTSVATKQIPPGYITKPGATYRVTVRAWDAVEREDTPGDPSYSEQVSVFTFTPSATPGIVTGLTATLPVVNGPGVLLKWARGVVPDYFAVIVDGVVVNDRVDPVTAADAGAGAGHYQYTYWGSRPGAAHTYEVAALVASGGAYQQSTGNATAVATPDPWGVWIIRPATGESVNLLGTDSPDLAYGDDAVSFTAVGRRDPVLIYSTVRGYEGSVNGQLFDRADVDRLNRMLGSRDRLRVSIGDLNIPVWIGPSPKVVPIGDERWGVELGVLQYDEWTVPS